jgi:hypothetical protein
MPHTFAYLRVSTAGQTTDNQLQEIAAAGFRVDPPVGSLQRRFRATLPLRSAAALPDGFCDDGGGVPAGGGQEDGAAAHREPVR